MLVETLLLLLLHSAEGNLREAAMVFAATVLQSRLLGRQKCRPYAALLPRRCGGDGRFVSSSETGAFVADVMGCEF
jgi:hypothetical protein